MTMCVATQLYRLESEISRSRELRLERAFPAPSAVKNKWGGRRRAEGINYWRSKLTRLIFYD